MRDLGHHEMAMLAALAIALLVIVWSLERRSKNAASRIQLDDLLIGADGKASKAAFVMGGSFIVTSWVVVYQAMNRTLSDITFAAYVAAWIVPTVTALIKGPSPVETSETTITQTTITPKETK